MPEYNVEAVVIRAREFGEADRLVHLLTPEAGRLRVVARGARRPKSRFTPAMQLFTHCHVQCYRGRSLDGVRQAQILESFGRLREDLDRMAHGMYACELADELVPEAQPAPAAFGLLLGFLRLLNQDAAQPRPLLAGYQLQLLAVAGLRPELARCVSCGRPPGEPDVLVSPAGGGVLCRGCAAGAGPVLRMARPALDGLRRLLEADLAEAARVRLPDVLWDQVDRAVDELTAFHLERPLRSAEFLRETRRGTGRVAAGRAPARREPGGDDRGGRPPASASPRP